MFTGEATGPPHAQLRKGAGVLAFLPVISACFLTTKLPIASSTPFVVFDTCPPASLCCPALRPSTACVPMTPLSWSAAMPTWARTPRQLAGAATRDSRFRLHAHEMIMRQQAVFRQARWHWGWLRTLDHDRQDQPFLPEMRCS